MAKRRKPRKFPGKEQPPVVTRTGNRSRNIQSKVISNLQTGKVAMSIPASPLGSSVGTILGKESKPRMRVHYEKAECSCGGSNERCSRCDGTGYYTKEIIDQFIGTPTTPWTDNSNRVGLRSTQESTFSNDQRGDGYGIRERGRFGSNPLYDDHE